MGERVYPRDSPPNSGEHSSSKPFIETPPVSGEHQRRMSQDSFSSGYDNGYGYGPNPGTYVVQVPKDRIFRVPTPENDHKFKLYTKKHAKKNSCRTCFCTTLGLILILIILLAITCGILYLVYTPKAPKYAIQGVQVKGVNLTSTNGGDATFKPVFNVTVKINNPNGKLGIYYLKNSDVNIYRDGVNICEGKLPVFYQPPNSVSVFSTELSGAGIVLSKSAREKLMTQQKEGKVPVVMDAKIPVKIKVGAVKTWTVTVKVKCDLTLNELTSKAKVVSNDCKVSGTPW